MLTTARLLAVQYRAEALFLLVGTMLGLVAAAVAVTLAPIVLERCGSGADTGGACAALGTLVPVVAVASAVAIGSGLIVPPLVALLVGVQLVAREVERGTAALPWILGASRETWFFRRAALVALAIGGSATLSGLAADAVIGAQQPGLDLGHSLLDWEVRGWLDPGRALAVFGLALLCGALVGRVLPALLTGIVVVGLIFGVFEVGFGAVHEAMARPTSGRDGLYLAPRYVDVTTGRSYALEAAEALVAYDDGALTSRFEVVPYGLPDADSRLVIGSEVGAMACLTGLGIAAATAVVRRRHPY